MLTIETEPPADPAARPSARAPARPAGARGQRLLAHGPGWRAERATAGGSRGRAVLGLCLGLLLGAALVSFGATVARVEGRSMEPTLTDGQLVVLLRPATERLIDGLGDASPVAANGYEVGDVVALAVSGGRGLMLKRVVAVGPASVSLEDGQLKVDGAPSEVGRAPGYEGGSDLSPVAVAAGELFLLGDNRRPLASNDSRAFGPVPAASVRGRLVARLPLP